MKKILIVVVILAVFGVGGYGVYYYYLEGTPKNGGRVSSSDESAVYVETVSQITGYGSGNGMIERYVGEAQAQETLEIRLDSARTVDECYVKEGDLVKKGQALFSYDTQEDADKIAQDEIDIEKNQMTIETNETAIAQQEKLMKSYKDADDQLQASLEILSLQNDNRSLQYEIQTKELEIEKLTKEIEESTVTAEMGGLVRKITDPGTQTGYYSASDSQAYITILAEGDYRIQGTVNEFNYYNLYEGMRMIVYSRMDASQTWEGIISEIKTEPDEDDSNYYYYDSSSSDTATYTFYVELDDSEGLLLGQHVYMEEDLGQSEEKEGLWLAEYYILEENGSTWVWLANTSNTIEKREVTLGEYDGELAEYEILVGLTADEYIAFPTGGIEEGDPVIYSDIAVVSGDDGGDYDGDAIDYDGGDYGGDAIDYDGDDPGYDVDFEID